MYKIGVDLGGTNIKVGIVDENNKILFKKTCKTLVGNGDEDIANRIANLTKNVIKESNISIDEIDFIGIGSPGAINPVDGVVDLAANLNFKDTPLASLVGKHFPGKKVLIENDANCATLAEYYAGAGKGTKSCVVVTLGTGVGGGFVVDGKIYSGFNYAGSEFGHMVIVKDGRTCTCGRKGCFEAYASVTALINITKEKMEKEKNTIMWELVEGDINNVDGRTAFDAMRKNDALGIKIVDEYVNNIACGITNLVNILQPEIVLIGGGISKEGDYLLKPIKKYVEKENFARYSNPKVTLGIASLNNDAGIIGAAIIERGRNE